MADWRPICLSLLDAGSVLQVQLSDGRGVLLRHGTPLPIRALDGERADAAGTLGAAIGDWLATAALRGLDLQLSPSLDRLGWESLRLRGGCLGQALRVTRQLIGAASDAAVAEPAPAQSELLRWCQLGAGVRAPLGWNPRCVWSSQSLAAAPSGTGFEVLRATAVPPEALAVLAGAQSPGTTRLWVLDEVPVGLLQALCAAGDAVLLLAGNAGDDTDRQLAGLLAEGLAVDEALRLLRVSHPAVWLAARLYGRADRALVRPAALTSDAADDRRQVTALSFDVVSSTALMGRLGAEHYAQQLSLLHEQVRQAVQRCGGMAGDAQGNDGVMNYFGYPVTAEYAALRAVEAALEISAAGQRLGLPVRVGLATGQVVVHAGQPFGPCVHLAARLQAAAQVGGVLVCPLTQQLTEPAFEFGEPLRALQFKGRPGRDSAHPVRGARRRGIDDSRSQRHTPFVGRDDELGRLLQLWQEAAAGATRVAVVQGEAGIGKSRLLRELRQRLQRMGQNTLECRFSAEGRNTAFQGLSGTLARVLGLSEPYADPGNLVRIQRALPRGVAEADDAVALLAMLQGIPLPAEMSGLLAGAERTRQRTLALLVQWLVQAAQVAPVCLLVEDLHWVDPSSGEFFALLLSQPVPAALMVVLSQRAEPAAAWQPAQPQLRIDLRRLQPDAARRLVERACLPHTLPTSLMRQLAARGDGVPLFLEESVRVALDRLAGAGAAAPAMEVPARLHDLLTLRLNSLSGAAKRLAQCGAVLGREFSPALLQAVAFESGGARNADEFAAQLAQLERSGLVLATGAGRELSFKHALVRDAAYQSLWLSDRCRLHQITAAVLERDHAALLQRQPELLARHLAEAGNHERAVALWEQAARRATADSAQDEAIAHLQQALALVPQLAAGLESQRTELRLQLLLAARLIATEGYGAIAVEHAYLRAAALAGSAGEERALQKIELGLEGCHFMRADFAQAEGFGRRALETATRLQQPLQQLQARWALANIAFHQGRLVTALQGMDDCLALYEPGMHRSGGVQDPAVMCLCYSAWGQWNRGHADEALARIERVLKLAQSLGHRFSIGEAHAFAASVHEFRGETAAALAHAERCIEVCDEAGFAVWLAHARITRGRLWCEQGHLAAGLAEMAEGYRQWCSTGAEVTRPFYLAKQAEGLALAGQNARGLELLAEARQRAQAHGEGYHQAELYRLTGELMLKTEDAAARREGEQWLERGLLLARQQQAAAFELRAATALARLWNEQGQACRAAALLNPLLRHGVQGHDTRDLRVAVQLQRVLDAKNICEGAAR